MASNFTAAQYAQAMRALLPRGRAWNGEDGSTQAMTIDGIAEIYEKSDRDAIQLLVDAFPATAVALLPEWEASLGLPDPCSGESPTLQGRQAQVVARLANAGGQSIPFFIQFLKSLGYVVTAKEYTPFRMGMQGMGDQLGGPEWAYAWAIVAPQTTLTSFRMGLSAMGEPLESWGNEVLECEMNSLNPAHTVLLFIYV